MPQHDVRLDAAPECTLDNCHIVVAHATRGDLNEHFIGAWPWHSYLAQLKVRRFKIRFDDKRFHRCRLAVRCRVRCHGRLPLVCCLLFGDNCGL